MRASVLWYRKPNRIALMLCLIIGCMMVSSQAHGAAYSVQVAPKGTKIMFKASESYDGYGDGTNHIDIEWETDSDRTDIYYKADPSSAIPPQYIEILTPYYGSWRSLEKPVLVLKGTETKKVRLEIRVSTKAWGPKGEWTTYIRCSNIGGLPAMTVEVDAKDPNPTGLVTLSVDGGAIEIEALTGPDLYEAKELVTATVKADHSNWMLKISGEAPKLVSEQPPGDTPVISLDDIILNIERNGKLIAEGRSLTANGIQLETEPEAGQQTFKISVKAQTHWETIAGEYRGRLIFTVMAKP